MASIDYFIIGLYLLLSLGVSVWIFKSSSINKQNYFLGDRQISWWWAGISIAATTFAADTPLAITGLVAKQGFSGNWIWLSWIIMHAAVVVYFARYWRSSLAITDAEIITLRYSGPAAYYLRLFKSGFYALIFNGIILSWVIRAMIKIITPFTEPSLLSGYEVYILTLIVAIYSATGGLKAVIVTDLFQLLIALVGSYLFAYYALDYIGGISQVLPKLEQLYVRQNYTNFFPSHLAEQNQLAFWVTPLFILYILTQAFANNPADGGGYIMQRLGSCRTPAEAKKAGLLFIFIQYIARLWPWLIVALVALIVFPIGQEHLVFDGDFKYLANDREAAYPALIKLLLPSGLLGLVLVGMLAAFMSTIDTHLNWGSSYVVNDLIPKLWPNISDQQQVLFGRICSLSFAIIGIVGSFFIQNISAAWEWLALIGACFAPPTLLRWFWWKINVFSEWLSIIFGIISIVVSSLYFDLTFNHQLVLTGLISLFGAILSALFLPETPQAQLTAFTRMIKPFGFWGNYQAQTSSTSYYAIAQYLILILGVVLTFFIGQFLINQQITMAILLIGGESLLILSYCFLEKKLS